MSNAKGKLVGINGKPSSPESIHGSELMVLLKDFELILKSNPQIDFAVRYAIEKTAQRHIKEISALEEGIVKINKEFLQFDPQTGLPVMNGVEPTYSEGKTKELHIKSLSDLMGEVVPFRPHQLTPERLGGVILDTTKSDFRVFQNYMIDDSHDQ